MSITRRVYFYLLAFITLGIFAAGVGILLSLLFDITIRGTAQVGGRTFIQEQLSLGLAMLVIGGPLWFFFWRSIQRSLHGSAEEVGSAIRKAYLNIIITVAALIAFSSAQEFLRWLMGGLPSLEFPDGVAALIVTGAIWYFHWRTSETEGQPSSAAKTLRRWYIYILSAWSLVTMTVGLAMFLNTVILYLPIWGTRVIGPFWTTAIQFNIASVVLGVLYWLFHWFRMASGDFDSTLRQVYLYLLTVVGSAIAGLVALTITFYQVLRWLFGAADNPANVYFEFLSWSIPTMLIAVAVWVYHRQIAEEEAGQVQERRLSAQRVHFYIMSFIGLGTLIYGVITMFGILLNLLINAISPPSVLSPTWWQEQLSLGLALLIVGIPLWLYYWSQIINKAAAGGITEWKAASRRIYLYAIVAGSIIGLAAVLVNIVFQLLNGLLIGTEGALILRNARWSLQGLIVAVPVLVYHWRIARQDQRRGAEAAAVRKAVSILISDTTGDIVTRIQQKLGYKINILQALTPLPDGVPALSEEDLGKLVEDIKVAPGTKVMLLPMGGKIIALPYQDK